MSFAHASVLNLAAVSRDCQVKRKTAEGYLEILEERLAWMVPRRGRDDSPMRLIARCRGHRETVRAAPPQYSIS